MMKINLSKSEREYLINDLYSYDLKFGDHIKELKDDIKNNLVLDNTDPTNDQIKAHAKRLKESYKELKELKESWDLNSSIIEKLKLRNN